MTTQMLIYETVVPVLGGPTPRLRSGSVGEPQFLAPRSTGSPDGGGVSPGCGRIRH